MAARLTFAVAIALCAFCKVNGGLITPHWTPWSTWESCSATCRQGVRYRTRSCIGGLPGEVGCPGRWWSGETCVESLLCYPVTRTTTTTTVATTAQSWTTTEKPDTGCLNPNIRGSYRGTTFRTISGYKCQRWDKQTPHPHTYTPRNHPDAGLESNNFCRNPDMDIKPWCFTTNPNKQWEYCEVIICEDGDLDSSSSEKLNCFEETDPQSYIGTVSVTESGLNCQYWNSSSPHKHLLPRENFDSVHLGDHNYCRNPDNDSRPWCYTIDPNVNWEYCNVLSCSGAESESEGESTDIQCRRPDIDMKPRSIRRVSSIPMFSEFNHQRTSFLATMSEGISDDYKNEDPENIVGGFEVTPGSIPWQASIRRTYFGSHFCGGALISTRWIISAAHCITQPQNPSSYYALVGDHGQFDVDRNETRVEIAAIHRHPGYSSANLNNDLALMKTIVAIEINSVISPVCLPTSTEVSDEYGMAIVSGWGTMQIRGSNEFLHQASVPVLSHQSCKQLMEDILQGMMCAGYEDGGRDSCQGDSGGPLVTRAEDGTFTLIGVVSWGFGCAEESKPVVYTRIPHYLHWIKHVMQG